MESPPPTFDLLAASLRADAGDLAVFLEVLAAKLAAALPAGVRVEYQGGLLSRKRVRSLSVQLGEHRYQLARSGAALEARHSHAVRGITLKTELLEVEAWIDALARDLAEQARISEQSRAALNSLLNG